MKTVNADELKKEISKAPVWTAIAVKEMIDEMTNTQVQCKECKHKDEIVNYCYENDRDVNSDDYCSYGEREGE